MKRLAMLFFLGHFLAVAALASLRRWVIRSAIASLTRSLGTEEPGGLAGGRGFHELRGG